MHYKTYKSILSASNGMNIYRGCTHGCIYCDSRSLCYQFDHVFEDIEVKQNAPEILDDELRRRRKPCMISTGSMCDPYLPLEEELQVTRRCLEVILRRGFGLAILTKSARILRDIDLLAAINAKTKCVAEMTLTTYDDGLCKILEPNVSTTSERFDALCRLRDAGVPTVVWLSPLLPFITDTRENLLGLLDYCVRAGVRGVVHFGVGMTLRDGDREYFYAALDRHFPGMKRRYIEKFGNAYECRSDNDAELTALLRSECAKHGILCGEREVFAYMRDFPEPRAPEQLTLF
ncbi:MAG: radical SAM protein [Oscillospiraceae bacterium]|jgi:DNA repair photolyase|nr:radical SAM protein [Oscillospiraceae bacterium]